MRQEPSCEQGNVMGIPEVGPVGVTPACPITDGGVVVVRAGESPVHGEGPQEPGRSTTLGDDTPALSRWIRVPELQQRLAQKAVAHPDHRFGDLYDLLTWESVLDEAATRLLANKGSRTPGLDGMDRRTLRERRAYHLVQLKQQLRDGTFQPSPVKRTYIPKKNGKLRPLGIPTLYDRWVQMAIKLILEPIFESDFAPFSHGFRPQRSCHTAVAHIHSYTRIRKRKLYWVMEGDIEGFFDHVHHKKLMALLRQRIRDQKLLDLIWRFLRAGVMEGELFKKTAEGTPQGGVLSPLLANIYLNHFDRWFADRAALGDRATRGRRRRHQQANFVMVRYADDFVIFSNGSKAATVAFKEEVKAWLADELHLTLSEDKTLITHFTDGFDFLGFTFKKTQARTGKEREVVVHYPSTASVQRAVERIADLTDRRHFNKSHVEQIMALNAFLRGWGEYFRHSSAKHALSYVGSRAFMRMWTWLVCKEKGNTRRGWRDIKAKYNRDNTWQVGNHRLLVLAQMPVDYPRHRAIPNPYLQSEAAIEEPRHQDPFRATWMGFNRRGSDWRPAIEAVRETHDNRCVICGTTEGIEVHHITARRKGGGHGESNLVPLCIQHHRDAERRNSAVSHQLRKITKPSSGEPDAVKAARPVRGEGL